MRNRYDSVKKYFKKPKGGQNEKIFNVIMFTNRL